MSSSPSMPRDCQKAKVRHQRPDLTSPRMVNSARAHRRACMNATRDFCNVGLGVPVHHVIAVSTSRQDGSRCVHSRRNTDTAFSNSLGSFQVSAARPPGSSSARVTEHAYWRSAAKVSQRTGIAAFRSGRAANQRRSLSVVCGYAGIAGDSNAQPQPAHAEVQQPSRVARCTRRQYHAREIIKFGKI